MPRTVRSNLDLPGPLRDGRALPVGPADEPDAQPPAGRRRGPVRSHGDPRDHGDRRHRRAAARPDGHRRAAEPHHRRHERRLSQRAAHGPVPPGQGHERDRRHRHVLDAGVRRRPRALRRRPGPRAGLRLQAVDDARRHHRARRALRIDGLGSESARAVGEEPDRRARASSPITARSPARAGIARGRRPRRRRASGCAWPRRKASTA